MEMKAIHGQILRQHHLFARMTDEQLRALLVHTQLINLDRGEHLFIQGDPANYFYFVITGCMKLFRALPDGVEKVIDVVQAKSTFAEALTFRHVQVYPVSAQAVEPTELFAFASNAYVELVRNDLELAVALLGDLSARLHTHLHEIETLSFKNSTIRVVRYFLNLLQREGGESLSIELPLAKRLIAAQLAIQPETLSRIFNHMRENGIIAIDGRNVQVLDLERLKVYE